MRHFIILFYAFLTDLYRRPLLWSDASMKLIFIPGFNSLRIFNSKARAYAEFVKAKRTVPAYRDFLGKKGFEFPSFTGFVPNVHEIPFTDKENYVKQYTMDERCVNGSIPSSGVVIDESSGSSGTATNWARGERERKGNARFIKFGVRNTFGKGPLFIINAFALGPWATGVNVTMSCVSFSTLKSLGPDKIKIENTLKHFGKDKKYLVMGYPPFLKLLVDHADINWKEYDVSFIFGGESMCEGMRDYLLSKGIKRIYSSLGASDLELNISAENDFTISLRKLLASNPELQKRILKHPGALPMLFQFNPSDFLFHSSEKGELIVTVCRPGYIAPKINYNLHDRGHVLQLKELYTILKELNIERSVLVEPSTDLPILLHYGRADMNVSFFGANISPEDVRESIYKTPGLSGFINSFCIAANEDNDGNKKLIVSVEMQESSDSSLIDCMETGINFFDMLSSINQDFREARKMIPDPAAAKLEFHKFGEGPFKDSDIRIKAKYIH